MSPPTCQDVTSQLELFALGECTEPERSAVEQHLGVCPTCDRSYREARNLVGLLDLTLQEPERLGRLHERIAAEDRRQEKKATVLPFVRRAASLAAMLVLTVGLSGWLGQSDSQGVRHLQHGGSDLMAVLLGATRAPGGLPEVAHAHEVRIAPGAGEIQVFRKALPADLDAIKSIKEERDVATGGTRLPPPQDVELSFEIRNTGNQPLQVWTGGEATALRLDLQGPGVLDLTGPADRLGWEQAKTATLKPGMPYQIPITKLSYRDRGVVHHLYWTEPGEYTLTVHFQTSVRPLTPEGTGFRRVTLTSTPILIKVEAKK